MSNVISFPRTTRRPEPSYPPQVTDAELHQFMTIYEGISEAGDFDDKWVQLYQEAFDDIFESCLVEMYEDAINNGWEHDDAMELATDEATILAADEARHIANDLISDYMT